MAPSSPNLSTGSAGDCPDGNIVEFDLAITSSSPVPVSHDGPDNAGPDNDDLNNDVLDPNGSDNDGPDGDGPNDNNIEPDPLECPSKRRLLSAEVRNMWNLAKLIRTLSTREQCIEFCEKNQLILTSKLCRRHRKPMFINKKGNNLGYFFCRKCCMNCNGNNSVSRAKNTWFHNVRMSLPRVFYIMYAYAHKFSYDVAIHEDFVNDGQCFSRTTIHSWYNRCREAVISDFKENNELRGLLGGPEKIVHVDKSKFGKRVCNGGQSVDIIWVLGIVEDGSEDLRLEFCEDDITSAEILIPLVKKHVLPGTTISTDHCSVYDVLSDHGYAHVKSNRTDSGNPLNESNGDTGRIASECWRIVKHYFHSENIPKDNFADWAIEYQWRRHILEKKLDPFVMLLNSVRNVYGVK